MKAILSLVIFFVTFCESVVAENYLEKQCKEIIAERFAISQVTLTFDECEVTKQTTRFAQDRPFEQAFVDAFSSLLQDGTHSESPVALARELCSGREQLQECVRETLRHHFNSAESRVTLLPMEPCTTCMSYSPEHGERVEENWLFFVTLPTLSDHLFWAIVPRDREKQVYNYGFN